MKRHFIILGIAVLLLAVGLSGCNTRDIYPVSLTINSYNISDYAHPKGRIPDEGRTYVFVNVTMTSPPNEKTRFSRIYFELYTTNGAIYEGDYIEPDLPDSLAEDKSLSFYIGFNVPKSTIPEKLVYEFSNFLYAEAYFD